MWWILCTHCNRSQNNKREILLPVNLQGLIWHNKEMFFMPTVLRKNEESYDASTFNCGGTTIFLMGS
jgi:hypothetical protein